MTWLLRLYPRRWQQRYGDEFMALMEERGFSIGLVFDVLRGAFDAWLNPDLGTAAAPVVAGRAAASNRDRFDKFTRRSRVVLRLAQDEAHRLRHQQIGTEHLLLGLLLEGEGVAAHVLADCGVQADELRAAILARAESPMAGDPQRVGLSQDAKHAIELSVVEANGLHHHYVGTEHLLLGLVAAGKGIAADLLRQGNVADLPDLRRHILRVLNEGGPRLRPPM